MLKVDACVRWALLLSGMCSTACTESDTLLNNMPDAERRGVETFRRLAGRVEWTDTEARINVYFAGAAPLGEVARIHRDPNGLGSFGRSQFAEVIGSTPPVWTRWVTPGPAPADAARVPSTTVYGAAIGTLDNDHAPFPDSVSECPTYDCYWSNLAGTVPRADGEALILAAVETSVVDLPDLAIAVPVEPPEILEPFSVAPDAIQWMDRDLRIRWVDGPGVVVVCASTIGAGVGGPQMESFCQASELGQTSMVFEGQWNDGGHNYYDPTEEKELRVTRVVEGTGEIIPGVRHDIASTATTTLVVRRRRRMQW